MDEIWEYDEAGDLIEKCVTCGEEIEPGTVEFCKTCKSSTHGDECLTDHIGICTAALPPKMPARSDRRKLPRSAPREHNR